MYVDLHCHSIFSDGNKTVPELINIAKKNNVSFFSITDHDCLESTKLIKSDNDIQMVNGIELSTVYIHRGKEMYVHLLGYDFDADNKKLLNELKRMRELLTYENIRYLNKLLDKRIYIPTEAIMDIRLSNYRWIYRQVEDSLKAHGYDEKYIQELSNKMKKYMPEYNDYEIHIFDAIDLINRAGGISVLAHPCEIELDDYEKYNFIKKLKDKGLMGIESAYADFTFNDFIKYPRIAQELGLLESVGSDFHLENEENRVIIGHGINDNLLRKDCSVKRYILERKK